MALPSKQPPGDGFLGWLGRQVGHIAKALQTDVTAPTSEPLLPPARVVYRDRRTEDQLHPDRPGVVLRRTVVDEVIVQPAASDPGADAASSDDVHSG